MKVQVQFAPVTAFDVPVTAKKLVLQPHSVVVVEKTISENHLLTLNQQAGQLAVA